jgi:AcrR family transcriptional regulator
MSLKLEKNYELLIQSFLLHLQSKSYDKISIEQVSVSSGMTRVNFYQYFTDKEDLLWKAFQNVYLDVQKRAEALDPETLLSDGKPLTFYAFQNIKEHQYFYKQLFVGGIPYGFLTKLLDYITGESFRTHRVIREKYTNQKTPYIYVNQFLSGAFFNLARNLLVSGEDWDPIEVSEFFTKLALGGISKLEST